MKIAIIGWYDRLNAGDERLRYSIAKLLSEHTLVFLNLWTWPVPMDLLQAQDWILIGGGGLWCSNSLGFLDAVHRWHPCVRAHLGVFGVSCENGIKRTEATEYLSRNAKFFHVRDKKSRDNLSAAGADPTRIKVFTDLTFLQPYDLRANIQTDGPISLCIPANLGTNNPSWSYLQEVTAARAVVGLPFNEQDSLDFNCLRSLGVSASRAFDIDILRGSSVAICGRFHAVVYSIQLGVPFVAIACSEKIEAFCRDISLDRFVVAQGDAGGIVERLNAIAENYVNNVNELAKIRGHLVGLAKEEGTEVLACLSQSPLRRYTVAQRAKQRLLRAFSYL